MDNKKENGDENKNEDSDAKRFGPRETSEQKKKSFQLKSIFGVRTSRAFLNQNSDQDSVSEDKTVQCEYSISQCPRSRSSIALGSAGLQLVARNPKPLDGGVCPSCLMPFDNNRKRRLIDACGHERCYSCLFSSESCPLCAPSFPPKKPLVESNYSKFPIERSRTLDGCYPSKTPESGSSSPIRNKVRTNGHFTYLQGDPSQSSRGSVSPNKSPVRIDRSPGRGLYSSRGCIVSPITRRRGLASAGSSPNSSPRFGRSLWTHKSSRARLTHTSKEERKLSLTDEERPQEKLPPTGLQNPVQTSDIYSRLGFLFADRTRRSGRPADSGQGSSASSFSSLEHNGVFNSCNTSPISTLTGSSGVDSNQKDSKNPTENMGSIFSMNCLPVNSGHQQQKTTQLPNNRRHSVTTSQPGQIEELDVFNKRTICARRSARVGRVMLKTEDAKAKSYDFPPPVVPLRPLYFEVPQSEGDNDPLFVGRHWLFRELSSSLLQERGERGIILSGNTGSGKTAIILQLVDYSCFGRKGSLVPPSSRPTRMEDSIYSARPSPSQITEVLRSIASKIVAYHFCQAENSATCLLPDFVHSIAAQLYQAPQLEAFRNKVQGDPALQKKLQLKECISDPHGAFVHGILEPLSALKKGNSAPGSCIIVVDALCEAEYHRPDTGDTISSFLARHALQFPNWLKMVVTVRAHLSDITSMFPFRRISLDSGASQEASLRDLMDYITVRMHKSSQLLSNAVPSMSSKSNDAISKFASHLAGLSRSSFLHAKLTLDLVEKGHLVMKSSNFKILPVTLNEIFLLHLNLRFSSQRGFERVSPILCTALAALNPLTGLELYHSVNSLQVGSDLMSWEDFSERMKQLTGLLVPRADDTYMLIHPAFREWLLRREEGESTKFLCDPRIGDAAIAFRLSRLEAPLNQEKTLEVGHHILKGHVYRSLARGQGIYGMVGDKAGLYPRDLQAVWIAASSSDVSASIGSLRNLYSPNVKVTRLLLLSGGSPDHITEYNSNSPLLCIYAAEGNIDMVSLLIEFGATIDASNNAGQTPLILASRNGQCDVVRVLIQHGANLNLADNDGMSPLVHAASCGHLNIVGYLISCDWPSGEPTMAEVAQQALVAAASKGHTQIVEFLLDMSEVRVNLNDSHTGDTALAAACRHGHNETVAILIKRGANVAATNLQEVPPILIAVQEGHWETAGLILQNSTIPALVDQPDATGKTALMAAAAEGHTALIELLLSKGANINRTDNDGMTALTWACKMSKRQSATCLLEKGADVDTTDKQGRLPLDYAAVSGDPNIVQSLIERGSPIEHTDTSGMRPLDRAISYRQAAVVQAFLRRGAKLSPVTWTMAAGKQDIMLILLGKLLDDGNALYKKARLKEAAHRYHYALKKLPAITDFSSSDKQHSEAFVQLRFHLLLNLARCKRKSEESSEAVDLTTEAIALKPSAFEAYYLRARARRDIGQISNAISDLAEATRLAPQVKEVKKLLISAREELFSAEEFSSKNNSSASGAALATLKSLGTSVDSLNEHDISSGIGSSCGSDPSASRI
ncbi:protein TANC2-like isoform X2 [Artemia franciscana]|uniref:protein TANC2-like isoform X2 n=2 Tax=Artemia franciscana TaxID=6661 RepID=UPI0032DB098A